MKLDTRALAIAAGLMWGGCILSVGIGNVLWPPYGQAFLDVAGSIYPGFHVDGTLGDVLAGSLYGVVDGLLGGLIIGWLYNLLCKGGTSRPGSASPS